MLGRREASLSGIELAGIGITGILLSAASVLTLAVGTLSRLEQRAWTGAELGEEEEGDGVTATVETSFAALGLARQLLLILLVVQLVRVASLQRPDFVLLNGVGMALVAYLLFDKLLPHGLLTLVGARLLLTLGAPASWVLRTLFGPLARVLSRSAARARDRHRDDNGEEGGDLGAFLDMAEEEGIVSESEEALLRGVADFEEALVRAVMTPRVDIISINAGATLRELRQLIARHRYSRIPVVREDIDHVAGVANLKDLVTALEASGEETGIDEICRPVWFVPETKRVSALLQEFQLRQEQIAVVVDEYGGTSGLVTLEDLVEEIVGEIQDEDEPQRTLLEVDGDSVIVSGKVEVEEVEEALGIKLGAGDFHTVGGLVFMQLGRVPEPGERLEHGGLAIEVLDADERRIHRVRITSR